MTNIKFSFKTNAALTKLSLNCSFTIYVLQSIAENLTNLTTLRLNDNTNPFPKDCMRLLFQKLENLKELLIESEGTIDENPHLNASITISNLKKLKRINVNGLGKCPELSLKNLENISTLETVYYHMTEEVNLVLNN